MMHYLRLSNLLWLVLIGSCAAASNIPMDNTKLAQKISVSELQPQITKHLYRCMIDGKVAVKRYHLSGLLWLKKMPDSTVHFTFLNEMGVPFFDIDLLENDSFQVNTIISKMNQPALIKTLEKDFKLLLVRGLDDDSLSAYTMPNDHLMAVNSIHGAEVRYELNSQRAIRLIENRGVKTVVTRIINSVNTQAHVLSDTIFIDHKKANFSIQLNAISDADVR